MSVFITSITDRKLRENLSKEKDFGVPKVVEQIQQKTYDRKNEKSKQESLISNQEKQIKEEPIHKRTCTEKYRTKLKKRPKERNCGYCYKSK